MRFLTILLSFLISLNVAALTFDNETVSYKILYKWGIISKQAGRATLTISANGDNYSTNLVARSEPWADRFYCVRDTLNGLILKDGFRPLFYEKIAHEGSEYKHDIVHFEYGSDSITGNCSRKAFKDGTLRVNQQLTLKSNGTTVDMLSSFYYMRLLPFQDWSVGHEHSITIFSGKRKENLTLKYQGIEELEIKDKQYACYHITFIFTSNSGKKTSDDMDAWITTDNQRIALQLEGKLPVGKVRRQLM